MYIPLPNQIKKCLKEIVFICCGNLFEGTTKYESWKLTRKHLFKRFFHIPMSIEKNFTAKYSEVLIEFSYSENPIVSIIIPVYKGMHYLENCLKSLVVYKDKCTFEVILIDDCPDDKTINKIANSPGLIKLYNDTNLGFLKTCNRGAEIARGKYLCFLNSDTLVTNQWLSNLIAALENDPSIGMIGSMLLNDNNTIQDAGWTMMKSGWGEPIGRGQPIDDGRYTYRRVVDCVTGACFVIEKNFFTNIGMLDLAFCPAFYEEFDLAFRVQKAGKNVVYEPKSKVVHLGSASYGLAERDRLSIEHHDIFVNRYKDILAKRPLVNNDFILRHAILQQKSILMIDVSIPHIDHHAGDVTIDKYLNVFIEEGWHIIYVPIDGNASDEVSDYYEQRGVEFIRSPYSVVKWLEENGQYISYIWIARPEIANELIPIIRTNSFAKVVYYTHDLHFLRMERAAKLNNKKGLYKEAAIMKTMETTIFNGSNAVISPSSVESAIISDLSPNIPVYTILPYFYEDNDIYAFTKQDFSCRKDILFIGGFPHLPNVSSVKYIISDIMPNVWKKYPDSKLYVVGYAPPKEILDLANDNVIVTGSVSTLDEYFKLAKVFLAPLTYGAGIKGKIVQAMQNGIPVVTNDVGIEGFENIHIGKDIFVWFVVK